MAAYECQGRKQTNFHKKNEKEGVKGNKEVCMTCCIHEESMPR